MISRITYFISVVMMLTAMAATVNAQAYNPRLMPLLESAKSFQEVVKVVDNFYSSESEDKDNFESQLLKWKRWEWYMGAHLGENGEYVNVQDRLWKAHQIAKQMQTGQQRTVNSNWTFEGPSSSPLLNSAKFNGLGRVDRIAFHPTDPNTIYIGTPAGGLWKTTDDGNTWHNLTDNLPSIAISGIVVSHANPNHIYLLTGDGDSDYGSFLDQFGYTRYSIGVLKSIDGGQNWELTGNMFPCCLNHTGFRLVQDPNNADVLLAATSDGLYRTENGGDSWLRESDNRHYDVRFKPGSSATAYATRTGEVLVSSDNGVTWQTQDSFDVPIVNGGRIQLGVTPASPSTVYVLAGPASSGAFKGLWKSTDSGVSFVQHSTTPNVLGKLDDGSDDASATLYDLALAPATNNSSKVAVAGFTVWRSNNSGVDWINSTSYREDYNFEYIHPDIHDLQYNPLSHHLYAANDGGVYKSTDHGVTWVDLSEGIETTMFYHMRVWNGTSTKMMAGCQDNGIKYKPGPTTAWWHIAQADGFDVQFNPLNGEPAYSTANRGASRYSNDGVNGEGISPDSNTWFKTIVCHNTMPETVLCGSSNIWRSVNSGDDWTDVGASGSWAMSACPSNNSRYYAAGGVDHEFGNQGNSGVFISSNNGASWDTISGNPGFPSSWTKITDIAPNPINSSTVYVTLGGFSGANKVYKSSNAGATWTNISANLPNVPVYCIGVSSDNGLYIGTDIGVFFRSPVMAEWMLWSNGLPNAPVTDIAVQDSWVRCATFGRGAYRSAKADDCVDNVTVWKDLSGEQLHQADNTITSTSEIYGGEGTFVTFTAGDYIELETGFEVHDNNHFHGYLGPCGSGGIPAPWQPQGGEDEEASLRSAITHEKISHAFPLGSIDHIEYSGRLIKVDVTTRTQGIVEFKLINHDLSTVLYSKELSRGQDTIKIDLSAVTAGFYHLMMYNDDRFAHFHEILVE